MPTGFPLLVRFILLLATVLAIGCATTGRTPSQLAVSLVGVRIIEASPFETRLTVTVRLTNRGPEAVAFTGSRHELTIQNRAIGLAVDNTDLTLSGLSSVTQEVELALSNFALVGLARDLQRDPQARYEIESTFFGVGAFRSKVRTGAEGVIDLRNLADAAKP